MTLEERSATKNIHIKRKYIRMFRAAILLWGLIAAANAAIAVFYWNNLNVQYDNSSGLVDDELDHVFGEIIKNLSGEKAVLFTTYEALAVFYKYKYNLSIYVFFVYKFFIENTINDSTIEVLLSTIEWYLNRGYTVFYLAGWPELDGYKPPTSEQSYKYFYDMVKNTFKYEMLAHGSTRPRASWNYTAPLYELLLLLLP